MNKKLYIWITFVLGLFLVVSCVDDYMESFKQESGPAYLSASEAQEFFESSFTAGHTRSVSGKKEQRKLDPGEFTPQWNSVQTSQDKGVGSVDVPLLAEYGYKAIRCEFKNGTSKAYAVDVTQKLIVLKSKHTEKKVHYLLTLIPDKDYYRKNKGDLSGKFIHAGEKNGYSGLAIYTHPVTSKIISVGKYEDGNLKVNVFLPKGKGTLESRIKKANELLDGIKVPRMKSLATRSLGEGEPEVFYCSICGQDASFCNCWGIVDDCLCGNCDLCGWQCAWCGSNPCTCDDDLYCPVCGYIDCICGEYVGCSYCGNTNCSGECQTESGGDSNPGGDIQGGNGALGKRYIPSANDKFARDNIPTTMDESQSQIKNTCAFSAISYMAGILGDKVTQGQAMTEYVIMSKDISMEGVMSVYLQPLLNHYFDISICMNIIESINNGDIIYMTASVGGEGHAIVVVGYDSTDNTLIFMDPLAGTLREEDSSHPFRGLNFYIIREKTN